MFGYHGRYLRIDLSRGGVEWVTLAEGVLRRFVGGVGLANACRVLLNSNEFAFVN